MGAHASHSDVYQFPLLPQIRLADIEASSGMKKFSLCFPADINIETCLTADKDYPFRFLRQHFEIFPGSVQDTLLSRLFSDTILSH